MEGLLYMDTYRNETFLTIRTPASGITVSERARVVYLNNYNCKYNIEFYNKLWKFQLNL